METVEEKKSNTQIMNDIYWKQMDALIAEYIRQNPEKYMLAQKKGEEIMKFDYNNPDQYVELREIRDYGEKLCRDVTYNGIKENELSDYEIKCIKFYLGKDDISSIFIED